MATDSTVVAVQPSQAAAAVPFQQIERMADAAAKSGLFGVKSKDQALALMLLSQAEGIHPVLAARDYHIVNGRPALKADTMLARFQQSGGKVEWKEYTDTRVTGIFSHPSAGSVPVTWTLEMAKLAGLAGKDVWKFYPRAMLRARCVSEGVRTCYPGVAVGTYTVEEAQDMDPKDITPEKRVEDAVESAGTAGNRLTAEEREDHLKAIRSATTEESLKAAFDAAQTHSNQAKDKDAKILFGMAKDTRKRELAEAAAQTDSAAVI